MSPVRPSPNFDLRRFLTIADGIATAFVERTRAMTAWVEEGILFSDGLCVCALCEMYEVQHLVESGRGYGGSTEMFARYFSGHGPVEKIWSVDLTVHPVRAWLARIGLAAVDPHVWGRHRQSQRIARERLSPFGHVELIDGDAFKRIPPIVRTLCETGARIGLFIDGPKEQAQMSLATGLLRSSPQVRFAALDDVGARRAKRYARFCASPYAVFDTSEAFFYSRYAWVNDGRLPSRMNDAVDDRGDGVGVLINR